MRKLLVALLVVMLSAAFIVGCGGGSDDTDSTSVPSGTTSELPTESPKESPTESPDEKDYVTVTFRQAGQSDVVKKVEKGTALTDIPTPAPVKGYTVKWDKESFNAIGENTVVNAVATANTYTITFDYGDSGFEGPATMTVTYDEEFELPVNKSTSVILKGVTFKIADTNEELTAGKYTIDKDITVKIVYTEKELFVEV